MTQQQLIDVFIDEKQSITAGNSGNLRIRGNKLIHYNTIIAEKYNDKILLNITRYSIVTGRIQKMLKESIDESLIVIIHKVPEGTHDTLSKFI